MTDERPDTQQEIVKLLALLARAELSQQEFIISLDKAGFGQKRIAELAGTTPNTVSTVLARSRKGRS